MSDTPRTDLAIVRFKKVMMKTGKQASDGFKGVLVSLVSEAMKSNFGHEARLKTIIRLEKRRRRPESTCRLQ